MMSTFGAHGSTHESVESVAATIGVVVPVYNRRANVDLLLSSLERQSCTDFQVVFADDGSTDGTRELVEARSQTPIWAGRLRLISCGPNQGQRSGRARNIGTANLDPSIRLLVMLDSDLIVPPDALERFSEIHLRHPDAAVIGAVEWLPPLAPDDLRTAVVEGRVEELRAQVPGAPTVRVEGTFVGPELRPDMDSMGIDEEQQFLPEWIIPLNTAWPLALYWEAGGFDETMSGYGYQDLEFGARVAAVGARCVIRPDLWALHVWHSKAASAMWENQRNLDRYLRRHGPTPGIEGEIDWTLWPHYHAERGGTVVRDGEQLWAISRDRHHRLALPDSAWAARLGHSSGLDQEISRAELDAITAYGTAAE